MLFAVLFVVLFAFFPNVSFAKSPLDLSGYIAEIPAYEKLNYSTAEMLQTKNSFFINILKLRVRPELDLGSSTKLKLVYEAMAFSHGGNPLFMPITDANFRQFFDLTWRAGRNSNTDIFHTIDRFYLRHVSDHYAFTIGRQRISWGTGRVWNPTDLFNPINPASFDAIEKLGCDALSAKAFLGDLSDITAVVQPRKNHRGTNAAVRLRANCCRYDLSLLSGFFDKRIVAGGDFAGNIGGAGVRGEFLFSAESGKLRSNFSKWILGIDEQLTKRIYMLLEYHYNGEGTRDRRLYDLERLAKGEIINLNKNYLFCQSVIELHPLVKFSLSLDSNLDDGSGFYGALLKASVSDMLDIEGGVQLTYGDPFDEFKYYPSIFYLKGILYF